MIQSNSRNTLCNFFINVHFNKFTLSCIIKSFDQSSFHTHCDCNPITNIKGVFSMIALYIHISGAFLNWSHVFTFRTFNTIDYWKNPAIEVENELTETCFSEIKNSNISSFYRKINHKICRYNFKLIQSSISRH